MKNNRILIVDDEAALRQLLIFELSAQGYTVMDAEDAQSALTLLKKEDVDLIISDVRMPGDLDGIDLIEAQRRKKPGQKVILMTGYALDERFAKAQKVGITHCIRKPFELTELESAIHQLLV